VSNHSRWHWRDLRTCPVVERGSKIAFGVHETDQDLDPSARERSQIVQDVREPTEYILKERGTPMAPLVVMTVAWIVVRTIGFASSSRPADSFTGALRLALVSWCLLQQPLPVMA